MVALVVEMVVVLVVAALVTVAQVVVAEDCEAKPKNIRSIPMSKKHTKLGVHTPMVAYFMAIHL